MRDSRLLPLSLPTPLLPPRDSWVNTGRLTLYADDGSAEWRECRHEIRSARYELRAAETIAWHVPDRDGHDDFVGALAVHAHAANQAAPPPFSSILRGPSDWSPW
ncbi:MAG TPA: hypothetical protein VFB58_10970 [Chloroflexota bacterium]|nr:hypothetical protein [Chloroflexota bacterium]